MRLDPRSLPALLLGALLVALPACVIGSAKGPSPSASPSPTASSQASPSASTGPCSPTPSVGQTRPVPAVRTTTPGDTLAFIRDGSIYVLPSDGQPIRLVGNVEAEFLSWSPDGQRLTYIACWQELRVLDLASGIDRTVMVDVLFEQQRPGFSGDGQAVYAVVTTSQISTSQPAGLLDVAVGVDLTTGNTVRVPIPPTFTAHGGAPSPIRSVQGSRSGKEVAWSAAPSQLVVFGSTGQVELRRTSDTTPAWNPTAEQLVYSTSGRGLILLDVASGRERVLDQAGGTHPVWSPDGRRIAYVKMTSDTPTIYVIDVATATSARLVMDPADFPTWSAEGQWIAYQRLASSSQPGYWNSLGLRMVRADGSGTPVQLTPDDGSSAPVFAPLPPGP